MLPTTAKLIFPHSVVGKTALRPLQPSGVLPGMFEPKPPPFQFVTHLTVSSIACTPRVKDLANHTSVDPTLPTSENMVFDQ